MSDSASILSPAEFSQSAAQVLAVEPETEIIDVDTLAVELRVQGRDITCDLTNFYQLYRNDPSRLSAVQQALVASLRELTPDRSEDDPAVLLTRVMPMLKPLTLLNQVREQQLPMLAYRPFAGDLMLTYVIDEGPRVVYINEGHLTRWRVKETRLYRQSLDNLRRKPLPTAPRLVGSGSNTLLILNTGDGYDATRLVFPELFEEFAEQIPGNVVIGVPNRDFLIAFSDADPHVFRQVQAQIETDARTQNHPLTDQLFTLRDGMIDVYTPNARQQSRSA